MCIDSHVTISISWYDIDDCYGQMYLDRCAFLFIIYVNVLFPVETLPEYTTKFPLLF